MVEISFKEKSPKFDKINYLEKGLIRLIEVISAINKYYSII